ncbi:MAG TPA: YCF48-related protein [Ignavibacteria bacterium]|nr:YCF48-related protein [Ignavibacteria bacterium]
MKNLKAISVFLVFNFIMLTPVLTQPLNDITSLSVQLVYAAGEDGIFMKSSNGGTSYTSTLISSGDLNGISAAGSRIWAAGDSGRYLSSTDLGASWTEEILGTGVQLNSIFFTDSLTGYISGNGGMILKTTNSGANWSALNSGVTFNLNKIKYTNSSTGFAFGESSSVLLTTNGGAEWNQVTTPSLSFLRAADISGNEIIAGSNENILYRSTNLGANWQQIPLKIYSKPGINVLTILSPQEYILVFESGTIWNTTNGGQTFTYPVNEFMDALNSVYVRGTRIYAVSKRHKMIVRSQDRGLNWSLTPNSSYSIHFVSILSGTFSNYNKILEMNYQKRGVLYALEKDKLYRTLNYGENWSIISTLPVDTSVRNSTQLLVNMRDSSKMLAGVNSFGPVGGEYKCSIFRTTNYGANWVRVLGLNIDHIGNFMNQDPQHPDTVYLGAKDTVFRSTDWGANWTKICEAPFEDWCDIAIHPSNSQIIYGSTNHYPAKLQKSTNGGVNWSFVDFVTDTSYSEMPAIATTALSPNVLLHAQLANNNLFKGLKRSYTSGNTWLFNQLPGTSWAIDIAKDDPNLYAYGSVSYDPVFLSTNSGGFFAGTSSTYAEQILYYDRTNLYVNSHGFLYKMRINYTMPVIGIENISTGVPGSFELSQNYPNPFNPVTSIKFGLPEQSSVKLIIYDALGREVKALIDSELKAGNYSVDWNAADSPSGVYFYRLITTDYSETRKMILIK